MREKATLRELDIALKSGVLSHPNLVKVSPRAGWLHCVP